MKIVEKNINELVMYENNPRKNDEAVKYVAESISQFGFKVPVIVDKDNVIVAGHTRVKAARKLKLQTVPCIVADDLTPEQIKAFRLADNKVSEFSEWDEDLLNDELDDICNIDMTIFGFDDLETNIVDDNKDIVEDDVPSVPEKAITQYGDIWIMGGHRLLCGDSTKAEEVSRLMNGEKADMVFTDPPYGMKKEKEGILNDNLNYDDLLEFNKRWIPLSFDYVKDNGSWYCWGTDEPLMEIYSYILKPMIKENKVTFRNLLTWDKGYGLGQLSEDFRMYAIADEKCLFVICGVQGFNNNADNYFEGWEPIRQYLDGEMKKCGGVKNWEKALGNHMGAHYFTKSQWDFPTRKNYEKLQDYGRHFRAFQKKYDVLKIEFEKIKEEYYSTRTYFDNTHDNMNNVWHFARTSNTERSEAGGHATPKPLVLCERAIKSSSREGEIILDLFGGSGSTLIACEQLNRQCYMMELDPNYCDVIVKRWEKLTGRTAELQRK